MRFSDVLRTVIVVYLKRGYEDVKDEEIKYNKREKIQLMLLGNFRIGLYFDSLHFISSCFL